MPKDGHHPQQAAVPGGEKSLEKRAGTARIDRIARKLAAGDGVPESDVKSLGAYGVDILAQPFKDLNTERNELLPDGNSEIETAVLRALVRLPACYAELLGQNELRNAERRPGTKRSPPALPRNVFLQLAQREFLTPFLDLLRSDPQVEHPTEATGRAVGILDYFGRYYCQIAHAHGLDRDTLDKIVIDAIDDYLDEGPDLAREELYQAFERALGRHKKRAQRARKNDVPLTEDCASSRDRISRPDFLLLTAEAITTATDKALAHLSPRHREALDQFSWTGKGFDKGSADRHTRRRAVDALHARIEDVLASWSDDHRPPYNREILENALQIVRHKLIHQLLECAEGQL